MTDKQQKQQKHQMQMEKINAYESGKMATVMIWAIIAPLISVDTLALRP
jgi:hypothetical protein